MQYFSEFPVIGYNLDESVFAGKLCTNITVRNNFLREISENMVIAYDYPMQESDRPEFISYKLYGDVYRNWIVLLNNKAYNPYYDLPLTRSDLHKYIINKYGYSDISEAYNEVHHYEKVIKKNYYENGVLKKTQVDKIEINDKVVTLSYDASGNETVTVEDRTDLPNVEEDIFTLPIVAESYSETFDNGTSVTITTTHDAVVVYVYEDDLNESKRTIRLIDAAYIEQIETEFKALMRNG